jgi:hypothetical protein
MSESPLHFLGMLRGRGMHGHSEEVQLAETRTWQEWTNIRIFPPHGLCKSTRTENKHQGINLDFQRHTNLSPPILFPLQVRYPLPPLQLYRISSHNTDTPIYVFPLALALSAIINNCGRCRNGPRTGQRRFLSRKARARERHRLIKPV